MRGYSALYGVANEHKMIILRLVDLLVVENNEIKKKIYYTEREAESGTGQLHL